MTAVRPYRAALISMPWASERTPSVAISTLKPCAERAGFQVDVFHFNLQFAARLGLEVYDRISSQAAIEAEWFFAQALFGPAGTGEVANSWSDLAANPSARSLVRSLETMAGGSEACNEIATVHVPEFIEHALGQADWSEYLAVGFTTTFAQSAASLLLAKRIKESHPGVVTIFGGASVESEMGLEFLTAFPWLDCVAQGEAEISFPQLLRSVRETGRPLSLPGVSIRTDSGPHSGVSEGGPMVDLNESPLPDYSDYIAQLERAGLSKCVDLTLCFESSRGCWWGAKRHCTFCGLSGKSISFRKKSADRVLEEVLSLSRSYRSLKFDAVDLVLAPDVFSDLLPRLAGRDLDLDIFYEVRANLTRQQVRSLRSAGIRGVQPGIESLSSRLLGLMNKGTTCLQNIQVLKWCFEEEIFPGWNILYAVPGETAEDYRDFPRIMDSICHLDPPAAIVPVEFQRFSVYHEHREAFGLKLRPRSAYGFVYPEGRVRLDRIAYYFEREDVDPEQPPEDYIAAVLEGWNRWKAHWATRSVFCYYQKGPEYLVVHDNRPRDGSAPDYKRIYLEGLEAAVFLCCDQRRTVESIRGMLRNGFGHVLDSEIVIGLDRLADQRLVLQDGKEYLALAVRRPPAVAAVRNILECKPSETVICGGDSLPRTC